MDVELVQQTMMNLYEITSSYVFITLIISFCCLLRVPLNSTDVSIILK